MDLQEVKKKIERKLPELVDEAIEIATDARSAQVRLEAIKWLASVVGLVPEAAPPPAPIAPVMVRVQIGALPTTEAPAIEGEVLYLPEESEAPQPSAVTSK